MLKTKAVVLAKVEVSYGVDPTPTPEANAILCGDPEIEPVTKSLERKNVKPYFGASPVVNIGEGLKLKFKTELKGSGAAGTAPEIGVLFRGCGFTESIVSETSVTYDPNSTLANESITLYFYMDGILHKMSGCRGTFGMETKAGEYGTLEWEFTGIYQGPVDASLPSPTFNATVPARFVSASFAIDSYAAIIETLKITINNEIARRPSANAATGMLEYFIKERAVKGEIDPEMTLVATKDWWSMWEDSDRIAFTATLGATAGNVCTITGPKAQLGDLKYGDRESLLTLAAPVIFTPDSGNDEIAFAFT